ncbi:MAG: preprotein translocase subunit SecE [Oscillospiraceae bacterium]|jgi:preprotein translocase subunit SecE
MAKSEEKRPNVFARALRRLAKWFREMKSELKKVVWPTRKQLINNTIVVIVMIIIIGIFIWIFDWIAGLGVKALINVFR